jgi:hypothetical protein
MPRKVKQRPSRNQSTTQLRQREPRPALQRRGDPIPLQRRETRPAAITPVEYGSWQQAFEHFNRELFANALPNVLITFPRRARMRGYFSAKRFVSRDGRTFYGELGLNPDGFIDRSDEQICSTLGHEMHHVWDEANGTAPKRHYHSKIWAAKMKENGLYPSSTGMVGGRETDASMSHYIIPDGAFARSYQRLAATGFRLDVQSAMRANTTRARDSKVKVTCPVCGQNAWGKPDLQVNCRPCGVEMHSAGDAEAIQSYQHAAE